LIDSKKGQLIFNHIVDLGKNLGFEIVAEGVEKKEQYEYIKQETKVDMIQGYYFSKPVSVEDLHLSIGFIKSLV
jgi:EAL domain-containing protein (putative c-di-GMP-specific phosphodiesterase class I)